MPTRIDLYKESGVNTKRGDQLVDWLQSKNNGKKSFGQVVSGIGGFAALYAPRFSAFKNPLLVASTDGVGTKLLLGLEKNKLEGLGEDLVAMCINDLYTVGARPLFFLDYFATGKLDSRQFKKVLSGIQKGCRLAETSLIGGETAELPGLYAHSHFDLAGFVVGIVDAAKTLGPQNVKAGDTVYAIASSGFHSNGYSLIRSWLKKTKKHDPKLIANLLKPTVIYSMLPDVIEKLSVKNFHALANITGGGISGNLPRVIPAHLNAHIDLKKIRTPDWMEKFIHEHVDDGADVEPVFNMGVGMIAVVDPKCDFQGTMKKYKVATYPIGVIRKSNTKQKESRVIYI